MISPRVGAGVIATWGRMREIASSLTPEVTTQVRQYPIEILCFVLKAAIESTRRRSHSRHNREPSVGEGSRSVSSSTPPHALFDSTRIRIVVSMSTPQARLPVPPLVRPAPLNRRLQRPPQTHPSTPKRLPSPTHPTSPAGPLTLHALSQPPTSLANAEAIAQCLYL